MTRKLLISIVLCVAHAGFAQVQVKVDNAGNVGMGALPNPNAKLLLYNSAAAASDFFGLHTTVNNTNSSLSQSVYGIYSTNTNASSFAPSYGAYFKNHRGQRG